MKFRLDHVIPIPLIDSPLSEKSLWKKDVDLDTTSIIIAEAPSGTGKTTLLSVLYGVRKDYDGRVYMNGDDISSFSIEQWAVIRREKISFVFQDLRLFPDLTALQNIQLKNQLKPMLSEEEIRSMAEQLGVGHRLDAPCGKLSLGQQQRVAIIRALAQPFEFLMLDEPFSHLDETNSRKAVELILAHCQKNNAGLLMTSLGPSSMFPFNQTIAI
ncbi:MAG TPA: ATP-binding cassette domain-containing protein [Bacteroidia bacterium]|nr:ATP-binding cassette domain-containing protein [Bacteroidia bacterium]